MEVTKIAVKFFAQEPAPALHEFVPVFHRWIQTHAVEDHLLIDVADYAHVIAGPGVVLVASEANFYFDYTNGQPGLLYTRKTPLLGTFEDRLRVVTGACLKAASALEKEQEFAGRLRFDSTRLLVRLDDRLLAPNNDATFAQAKPAVEGLAAELYDAESFSIERPGSAGELFQLLIKSRTAPTLPGLLGRLHATAGR